MITPQNAPRATPPKFNFPSPTHTAMTLLNAPVTIVSNAIVAIVVVVVASLSNCMQFLQQIPNGGKTRGTISQLCTFLSCSLCLSPSACLSLSCMSQLFSYALDLLCFRSFPPHLVIFFCQLEVLLLPAGATLKGVPRLAVLASWFRHCCCLHNNNNNDVATHNGHMLLQLSLSVSLFPSDCNSMNVSVCLYVCMCVSECECFSTWVSVCACGCVHVIHLWLSLLQRCIKNWPLNWQENFLCMTAWWHATCRRQCLPSPLSLTHI